MPETCKNTFEQGTLDSLWRAKLLVERAISEYNRDGACARADAMNTAEEAIMEVQAAISIGRNK